MFLTMHLTPIALVPIVLACLRRKCYSYELPHTNFTTQLKSKDYTLPYLQKGRGIVITAGGSHFPMAVVSTRMHRRTGSELPVEVFLASQEEWDPQICDAVFLAMNTRCVVLQDIFDAAGDDKSLRIDQYRYKVMSIVFSSFEEVLFMDSDYFFSIRPIRNI